MPRGRTNRPYPPEYRAEVVRLVREGGRTPREAAAEVGCSEEAIRNWLKQAELDAALRHDGDADTQVVQTATTKYEYGDSTNNPGRVTKVIPPRGNTNPSTPDYSYALTLEWHGPADAQLKRGTLKRAIDALNNVTSFDPDFDPNAAGVQAKVTDPLSGEWVRKQQTEGQLAEATAPGGITTRARYAADDGLAAIIDPRNQVTKYDRDARGLLTGVHQSTRAWTDPAAAAPAEQIDAAYSYDDAGNLSLVKRAAGHADERGTAYEHDGLGRLRREPQYPSWVSEANRGTALTSVYTYDLNSNVATYTDPRGQVTTLTYDRLDRPTATTFTNAAPDVAATANVTYGYDPHGNRTSMATAGLGTTTYAYDELDRLLSVTTPDGAGGGKTVGYRYDLDGNRSKLLYPAGSSITHLAYAYDKAGRLQTLTDSANRTTGYAFFADGTVQKVTLPNGTATEYLYDAARRVTEVWHHRNDGTPPTTVSKHTYTLDPLGNREAWTETLPEYQGGGGAYAPADGSDGSDLLALVAAPDADGASYAMALPDSRPAASAQQPPLSPQATQAAQAAVTRGPTGLQTRGRGQGLYGAWTRGYFVDVFDRAGGAASVRLEHEVARTVLEVRLPGAVLERAAAGPVASARTDATAAGLGVLAAQWTSHADRVEERLTLAARPAGDAITLPLTVSRLAFITDDRGGLQAQDSAGRARFHLVAPVARDAAGRLSAVTLTGEAKPDGTGALRLALDPAFAAAAAYPVTMERTTHYTEATSPAVLGALAALQQGAAAASPPQVPLGVRPATPGAVAAPASAGKLASLLPALTSPRRGTAADGGCRPDPGRPANTMTLTYDCLAPISQLLTVQAPTADIGASEYWYDRAHNRSQRTQGPDAAPLTTTYSYDKADRLTAAGAAAVTTDNNGNTTRRLGGSFDETFVYDQANRLVSATIVESGTSVTTTFTYNGDGRRIRKSSTAGTSATYTHDLARALPTLLDDGTRSYVWGAPVSNQGLLYAIDRSGNTLTSRTNGRGLGSFLKRHRGRTDRCSRWEVEVDALTATRARIMMCG